MARQATSPFILRSGGRGSSPPAPAGRRTTEGHDRAGNPAPRFYPNVRQGGIHYTGTTFYHSRLRHAEDIYQLALVLKLEDVYIVGHDIGGHVAYAFMRRFPQITRGA